MRTLASAGSEPKMSDVQTWTYLCIGCPLGCRLEVDADAEHAAIVEVRGFSCRRGREYAIQEHMAPQRIVTTTVAIEQARWPRLSVRSRIPVPKAMVRPICVVLRRVRIAAPVTIGDIIVPDILGTGIDMIATRTMPLSCPDAQPT